MKIVFISNYYNHHQSEISKALFSLTEGNFHFIETEPMLEERRSLGYGDWQIPDYVIKNYEDEALCKRCKELIDSADVVLFGHAPYELIKDRLDKNKLVFVCSERLYKKSYEYYKMPVRTVRLFKKYTRYKNLYLLAASAYTAADYSKTLTFLNKAYKWGYFPEVKTVENTDSLIDAKVPSSILWVARFIDWKHPEVPLAIAKKLKADGYSFTINMIGNGEMSDEIAEKIKADGLSDCVHMLGSMKPTEVREHMEKSELFLFTSDRGEGWGAVLNESMNSACAVVASHAIGSVPFLINDGENGFIYRDGDIDDLYKKVKCLLDNREERVKMAKKAYLTMIGEWNAENAARKLLTLANAILNKEKDRYPFKDGVLSKSEILGNKWYKK